MIYLKNKMIRAYENNDIKKRYIRNRYIRRIK